MQVSFYGMVVCADSVYDEKMEKQRKWEKKQSKLKDIDEARKKQESKCSVQKR